jgi:hypothetical protein
MSPEGHTWNDPPRRTTQDFLVQILEGHDRVREVVKLSANRYDVERSRGEPLKLFLTNVYILGEADYERLRSEYPEVNVIVLASNWNSCTMAVKDRAIDEGVAIFDFSALMGAANITDDERFLRHRYADTDHEGRPRTRWP